MSPKVKQDWLCEHGIDHMSQTCDFCLRGGETKDVMLSTGQINDVYSFLGAYAEHLKQSAEWVTEIAAIRERVIALRDRFRDALRE